jgi:hypothetical protein
MIRSALISLEPPGGDESRPAFELVTGLFRDRDAPTEPKSLTGQYWLPRSEDDGAVPAVAPSDGHGQRLHEMCSVTCALRAHPTTARDERGTGAIAGQPLTISPPLGCKTCPVM